MCAESQLNEVIEQFEIESGINLLIEEDFNKLFQSNMETRIALNKLRRNQFRIKATLEIIQKLASGLNICDMNEWDAAKLMNIGTITGKYQQRALKMKVITADV